MDCLTSMATRRILADLATLFEQASGRPVTVRSMGGVDAARLVREGEVTDVVVLAAPAMRSLAAEGHVTAGTLTDVARSLAALAVRSGAPRPSIADGAAVRTAFLAAAAIGYSTGPSGDHLLALIEQWGLREALEPRLVRAPPGVPVATLVADGRATIGVQQVSELLGHPGIDILGPLPPDIQSPTLFTAGVAATSPDPASAREFVAFLASREAGAVCERFGMQPVARAD